MSDELTFSSDDTGRAAGIAWLTTDADTGEDTGHLACPCSRYGRTSADCAPVAWILARILADANGDEISARSLDHYMSLVVNDSDGPEETIREHGTADDLEVAGLPAVSEAQLEQWTAEARDLGRDAGKAAATWIVDGNTSPENIARMVEMIDAGDPEFYDHVQSPTLSGEFAEDPTPLSLAREIIGADYPEPGEDTDGEIMQALADAWDDGVGETFGDACETILRAADTLPTDEESADFLAGYLDSLAWCGCYLYGPDGENIHESGESETIDPSDIPSDDVESAREDCASFLSANLGDVRAFAYLVGDWTGEDVRGYRTIPAMGCAGGDFYLSRCGHGAGYFDRDAGELGDRLQDAARVYGDQMVFMADPDSETED